MLLLATWEQIIGTKVDARIFGITTAKARFILSSVIKKHRESVLFVEERPPCL